MFQKSEGVKFDSAKGVCEEESTKVGPRVKDRQGVTMLQRVLLCCRFTVITGLLLLPNLFTEFLQENYHIYYL